MRFASMIIRQMAFLLIHVVLADSWRRGTTDASEN